MRSASRTRARRVDEYPFQLSGGMKQRVMIALGARLRARAADRRRADHRARRDDPGADPRPAALSCRRSAGCRSCSSPTISASSRGWRTAWRSCTRAQIVEVAEREAFFRAPQHPYSRKLFAALPATGKRGAELRVIRRPGAGALGRVHRLPVRRPLRSRVRALPHRGRPAGRRWRRATRRAAISARAERAGADRVCALAPGESCGMDAGGASACRCSRSRPEGPLPDPAWRLQAHGRPREGGGRRLARDRAPAARWRSSASRAAARRPSARASCGSSGRPPAR